MAKNKLAPGRNKAKADYLLTGKIFCGKCGGAMVGMSAHGNYTYYECSTRKRTRQCDRKPIRREKIEDAVLRCTLALLTNETIRELAEQVAALSRKECAQNSELQSVEPAIRETENRIDNISNAIAQGIITPTTKRMLEQAENDRAQLVHRRNELQSIGVYPVTVEQVVFWLEKFRDFDIDNTEDRRMIVDSLINSVFVYDDGTINIFYNAHGKTHTIKRSDLQDYALTAPQK